MRQKRRSMRLPGYDYSRPGAYFVTICTQNRQCLFGDIVGADLRVCPMRVRPEMVLNDAGRMVQKWFHELENKFPDIRCDEFIIMPNHIHFIVFNVGADLRVCPDNAGHAPGGHIEGEHRGSPLHVVVQWFKTMTTNEYIRGVKQQGWPRFDGKLWQRNYYEHIVRDDDEWRRIREYIANNPRKWDMDRENPHRIGNQRKSA